MKILKICLISSLFLVANNITLEEALTKEIRQSYQVYKVLNKYDIFLMLVKNTSFVKGWNTDLKNFHLDAPIEINNIIETRVYIDKEGRGVPKGYEGGSGTIGSVNFNILNGELGDITYDDKKAIPLNYDKVWSKIFNIYHFNKPKEFIYLKKKTFLYKKTNLKNKSKKFLIKNDCALIVDKTDDGWYQVFFYHPHLHTNTIMWIKFDADKHGLIK